MADVKQTIAKSDRLLGDRTGFESQWREVRLFIAPLAAAISAVETPGAKRRSEILDNSSESISELLASTVHGELANPAEFWFKVETEPARLMRDPEVAAFVADIEEKLYRIFRSPLSGWSVMLDKWISELVDFGTATSPIIDQPGKGIRFRHVPIGETALDQDADGEINAHYRRFMLTVEQAFAEWGPAAGPKVAEAAANDNANHGQEFEFLRAVRPLREPDSAGRRFESVWINVTEKHQIAERGFFDFPYMVARWKTSGNERYGRGPGLRALADVKMLQRSMRTEIGAAELVIAPPLLAADDGILGPISLASRAVTTFRSDLLGGRQPPVQPLLTGGRIDLGEEFNEGIRERIRRSYYAHLLQLPRDPRLLQDQFLELAEERARVLGPVFGRIYEQAFGPLISRLMAILVRAGATLPVPAVLGGGGGIVQATFKSPFAQAKQVSEARAIARFWTVNAPLLERDPTAIDHVDTGESLRLSGEGLGVPRGMWRDPRDVEARQQQRAKAQAARDQAELVATGAGAAQSLAQAAATGGAAA